MGFQPVVFPGRHDRLEAYPTSLTASHSLSEPADQPFGINRQKSERAIARASTGPCAAGHAGGTRRGTRRGKPKPYEGTFDGPRWQAEQHVARTVRNNRSLGMPTARRWSLPFCSKSRGKQRIAQIHPSVGFCLASSANSIIASYSVNWISRISSRLTRQARGSSIPWGHSNVKLVAPLM